MEDFYERLSGDLWGPFPRVFEQVCLGVVLFLIIGLPVLLVSGVFVLIRALLRKWGLWTEFSGFLLVILLFVSVMASPFVCMVLSFMQNPKLFGMLFGVPW